MENADKDMIYVFLNRAPTEEEIVYRRGVCRIWPIDDDTYYMDPAPHQCQGLFNILPKEEERQKEPPPSKYIIQLAQALEKLNIGKNCGKKGSRKWIANHKVIKSWKLDRRKKCGRL